MGWIARRLASIGTRAFCRFTITLSLILLLSGCATIDYYSQAVIGQISLLAKRRTLPDVIADPATPPAVREKLSLAIDILHFASEELSLPADGSYSTFVDIGRTYVVWNVFAAPELSIDLKSFCYPIAGCVGYRGFFAEPDARAFAKELADGGYDVFVGGVTAYSTLGWFEDPILNTFITRDDVSLAALLFHELAHKAVYVPGDTEFNESFATAVEQEALKRWLASRQIPLAFSQYREQVARQRAVIDLIVACRSALAGLYNSGKSDEEMRPAKAELITRLKADYERLRAGWGPYDDFKLWMGTDINNAKLGTIAAYNNWVVSFDRLLDRNHGDMAVFLADVRQLSQQNRADRDQALRQLAATTVTPALQNIPVK
jgi:predicted aminopeptidase